MTRKKWIIVAIIVILLIVGGILTWWLLRSQETSQEQFNLPEGELVDREIADPTETSVSSPFLTIDRFRRITGRPVSGFISYSFKESTTQNIINAVRFIDRATGSLYEITSRDTEPRKIIASTFPKTFESTFSGPNYVLNRSLDESDIVISEVVRVIIQQDGSLTFKKVRLEDNITAVAGSQSGMFAYLIPNNEGSTLIVWNSEEERVIKRVNLDLSDWNITLLTNNDVILSTPPASNIPGYSYRIRSNSSSLEPELRKIPGLIPSFSPDGSRVLYSTFSKDSIHSFYQVRGGEPRVVPFVAHASECSWLSTEVFCPTLQGKPSLSFPETWYTGKTSLEGDTFSFDPTVSSDSEFLFSSPIDTPFDVESLSIDPTRSFLYFINRNDLTLWEYNLVQ